jgi:hypothetical protein
MTIIAGTDASNMTRHAMGDRIIAIQKDMKKLYEQNCKLKLSNERLVSVLENLLIGIGMGWDLDGLIEEAKGELDDEQD